MSESDVGDAAVGLGGPNVVCTAENLPSSPDLFVTPLSSLFGFLFSLTKSNLLCVFCSRTNCTSSWTAVLLLLTSHDKAVLFRAGGRRIQLIIKTSGTPVWSSNRRDGHVTAVKKYTYTEIHTNKEQSELFSKLCLGEKVSVLSCRDTCTHSCTHTHISSLHPGFMQSKRPTHCIRIMTQRAHL